MTWSIETNSEFAFGALVPFGVITKVTAVVTAIVRDVKTGHHVNFFDQRRVELFRVQGVRQLLLHAKFALTDFVPGVQLHFFGQPTLVGQHVAVVDATVNARYCRKVRRNVERDVRVSRCRNE